MLVNFQYLMLVNSFDYSGPWPFSHILFNFLKCTKTLIEFYLVDMNSLQRQFSHLFLSFIFNSYPPLLIVISIWLSKRFWCIIFQWETCVLSKYTCESQKVTGFFFVSGASRVRDLPPLHFCNHSFVLGKASEAGFGNEMYKILTAAALSIMLNRSLIIGQTRHIGSFSSLSVLHSKLASPHNKFSYITNDSFV